ncbi:hypothetical protein DICA3_A03554 [Diutina catenulata]
MFKTRKNLKGGTRRKPLDDGDADDIVAASAGSKFKRDDSDFVASPRVVDEPTGATSARESAPQVLNLEDMEDDEPEETPRFVAPAKDDFKITAKDVAYEYGEPESDREVVSGEDDHMEIIDDGMGPESGPDLEHYHMEINEPAQVSRVLNLQEQINSLQNMRQLAVAKKNKLLEDEARLKARLQQVALDKQALQSEFT